jgi:hypothetical protein
LIEELGLPGKPEDHPDFSVSYAEILRLNGIEDAFWALRTFPDVERVREFLFRCVVHAWNNMPVYHLSRPNYFTTLEAIELHKAIVHGVRPVTPEAIEVSKEHLLATIANLDKLHERNGNSALGRAYKRNHGVVQVLYDLFWMPPGIAAYESVKRLLDAGPRNRCEGGSPVMRSILWFLYDETFSYPLVPEEPHG